MSEIRNLTRNGETFYPLTHEKAVIGMEDFKDTITTQISQYKPIEITGDVTNAPDEEDITSDSNNLLKFKNRNNLYGLGKVILRRGSSFASQVTQANTIYVIQYNFDLNSARINVPNGSILMFEGGTLSNGTLVCANLYDVRLVYYQDVTEILSSVTLEGNFIHKACDKDTIRQILVDNSSITKDINDVLSVKAGGIQNIHLNSNVVDDSSIALNGNNKISIKDGGVTGNKLNSGIVNTDDLSIINNKIQLSNRGTTDGMGKIILRKDQSFASQLTQQNTIYVIRYNFTLTQNVAIPANCILNFNGGSINGNYTITLNNTEIIGSPKIKCVLVGTIKNDTVFVDWFVDASVTDGNLINASSYVQGGFNIKPKRVIFSKGYYSLDNIVIKSDIEIIGNNTTIKLVEKEQSLYNFTFLKGVFSANVNLTTPARIDNGVRNVLISGFNFEGISTGTVTPDEATAKEAGLWGEAVIYAWKLDSLVIENCKFDTIENYVTSQYWPGANFGTKRGILVAFYDVDYCTISDCEITNCRGDEQIFGLAVTKPILNTHFTFSNNYIHDEAPGINSSVMSACVGYLNVLGNRINNYIYPGSLFNTYSRFVTIKDNTLEIGIWCTSVFDCAEQGMFYNESVIVENNYIDAPNSIAIWTCSKYVIIKNNILKAIVGWGSAWSMEYRNLIYPYHNYEYITPNISTIIENNTFDATGYDNTHCIYRSVPVSVFTMIIDHGVKPGFYDDGYVSLISMFNGISESVVIRGNLFKVIPESSLTNDPNNLDKRGCVPIQVNNLKNLIVDNNIFEGLNRCSDMLNRFSIVYASCWPDYIAVTEWENDSPVAWDPNYENERKNLAHTWGKYQISNNTINNPYNFTYIIAHPRINGDFKRYSYIDELTVEYNITPKDITDTTPIHSYSYTHLCVNNAYIREPKTWFDHNSGGYVIKNYIASIRDYNQISRVSQIALNTLGVIAGTSVVYNKDTSKLLYFQSEGCIPVYKITEIPVGTKIAPGLQIHDSKYYGYGWKALGILEWDGVLPAKTDSIGQDNPCYSDPDCTTYEQLFNGRTKVIFFKGIWWVILRGVNSYIEIN